MSALRKALEPGHKRKFLVVVDETPECRKATQFAARRADRTNGGLVLLYVIPPAVFQQWKGVEDLMRAEAMEKAETLLGGVADLVRQWSTVEPQQVIREGDTATEVTALIERDEDIAVLVLGAGSGKEGPGPLVATIAGRVAGTFPVPITIVPGNLDEATIAAIA
ncbi:MAG: universal stress protein [Bauldia sp.]|nr:universal stress protein [Bauldia sp.]